jgi:hypothetical protein
LPILFLTFFFNLYAAIEAPNYNFDFDSLTIFMPGKAFEAVQTKLGVGEQIGRQGDVILYRFYVRHVRYKFPVFVQVYQGNILDFTARLPSYFLHDTFHQALINRFRKQDKFQHQDNTSVYMWLDREGADITYSGACTITCFPIFVAAKGTNPPATLLDYRAITQQMNWTSLY